jgi:hypothetical protein
MRVLLAFALLSIVPLPAQDDVLAVERREDLSTRDAAARLLQGTRLTVHFEGVQPKELCQLLARLSGDKLSFVCAVKGELAATSVDLQLRATTLWSTMALVESATALRFVWRSGVVFCVGKDDIKPFAYVEVYDLRPMVTPLHNFPGPRLGLRGPGDEGPLFPPEEESTTTISGFTADGVEQLLKDFAAKDTWAHDDVGIVNNKGLLLIRQTPQGHREVQRLLVQLGLWSPPRVIVQTPSPPRAPASPPRR